MLLDHCKGFKIFLSFAVFHGVLSELHHLVAIAEEYGMYLEEEWMKLLGSTFDD
jgi:hypothetical protein